MQTAAERFGPVYLCAYRANGRTHTVRVRARSNGEAVRKMAEIDWAPDCGPIGEPRLLEGAPAARQGRFADAIETIRTAFAIRWA